MIDGTTYSKMSAWSPGTMKLSYWYDGVKAGSEEDTSPWPYYFTIDLIKEVSQAEPASVLHPLPTA